MKFKTLVPGAEECHCCSATECFIGGLQKEDGKLAVWDVRISIQLRRFKGLFGPLAGKYRTFYFRSFSSRWFQKGNQRKEESGFALGGLDPGCSTRGSRVRGRHRLLLVAGQRPVELVRVTQSPRH